MDGLAIKIKRSVIIAIAVIVAVLCIAAFSFAMQRDVAYAESIYTDADVARFNFSVDGATTVEYNGSEQALPIAVTLDGEAFNDITVQYYKGAELLETAPKDAGDYTAKVMVNNSDPVIYSGTFNYKIIQKPIKIVISGNNTFTYTGNAYARNISTKGVVVGDNCDIITTYRGNIDQLEAGVLPRDVDDYDMTFATSNPNYKIGEIEGDTTLKINKNTLTVTAKNVSITIGDAMPEFTYDIIGYCGEDDDSQVSVMPVINSHASAVGVHDLIPSGGNSRNYNFKYVKGYLTINGTDVNGQIEGTSSSFSIKGVFAPNISYLGSTVDVKADEAKNFEKTARDYRMLNFTAKLTHVYKLDIQNGSQISEKVSISIDNVTLNAKNKYFIVVIDHNGVVSKVTKYQFVDGVLTFNSYGVGTVLVFQDNLAMTILYICIGALAVFTIMLYITSKFTYIVRKKGLEEDRKNKKHETKYQW